MTNVTRIRVRYAETDQMGIVYYANYLVWMEIGRTNLMRDMDLTYKKMEEKGIMLPVTKACARYLKSALYDDEVDVYSTITMCSGARVRIDYKIKKGEALLCTGYTEHVFLSIETKKILRIPIEMKKKVILPDNPKEYMNEI